MPRNYYLRLGWTGSIQFFIIGVILGFSSHSYSNPVQDVLNISEPSELSYLNATSTSPLVTVEKEVEDGQDHLERIFTYFFPETNPKNSIRFYLFTHNRTGSEEISIGNPSSLRRSQFDSKNSVKILIHGYKRNGFSDFPHIVKDAYLRLDERREVLGADTDHGDTEYNVVCVDWRRQAKEPIYLNSAFNTRMVGERVGEFVLFLQDSGYIPNLGQVHLVGFSLGAQVAGYAGKYVKSKRRVRIGRITGLDPAGPAFTGPDAKNRLDRDDAEFVDVIHTSIWKSGLAKSIGHADFFPNSGEDQPGCSFEHVVDPFLGGCSHTRAVELFTETIRRQTKMYGCRCESWSGYSSGLCDCSKSSNLALMGEYCDPVGTRAGNYYLRTDGSPPYLQQTHPPFNATAAFQIFLNKLNSNFD